MPTSCFTDVLWRSFTSNCCVYVYAEPGSDEGALSSDAEDDHVYFRPPQQPTDLWAPQTSWEKYKERVSKGLERSEDSGGGAKWKADFTHGYLSETFQKHLMPHVSFRSNSVWIMHLCMYWFVLTLFGSMYAKLFLMYTFVKLSCTVQNNNVPSLFRCWWHCLPWHLLVHSHQTYISVCFNCGCSQFFC